MGCHFLLQEKFDPGLELVSHDHQVREQGLTPTHLSQRARSWLWPALTNIILALKSSCFMMSVSSPASTSGLVSPCDSLQQCSISWWPQATLSSCRVRMAMHREALGAWPDGRGETRTVSSAARPGCGCSWGGRISTPPRKLEKPRGKKPNSHRAEVELSPFQKF